MTNGRCFDIDLGKTQEFLKTNDPSKLTNISERKN